MFGGSAASIRRQVLALVMMPESGWLTSCAIDAVNAPKARDPGNVCEFRSCLAECLFRESALRYVLNRADVFQSPVLIAGPMSESVEILDRIVGHQQPVVVFEVLPRPAPVRSCHASTACLPDGLEYQ